MQEVPPSPVKLKELLDQKKLYDLVRFSNESGVFDALHVPATPQEVASAIGSDERFCRYLLEALCISGFIDRVEDCASISYSNTITSDLYLRKSGDYYVGDRVFNETSSYDNLMRYLKEGAPNDTISQKSWTPEIMDRIASHALLGWVQTAVEATDLSGHHNLLDIGGGHGLYSIFFTKRYPGLKATVFDFPQVIPAALKNIARFDAGNEVDTLEGDYVNGVPREKYDVVFVSNVAARHSDLLLVLNRAKEALVPGGIVIVRNAVFGIRETGSSIFTLEKFAYTGRQWFTEEDIIETLTVAGFNRAVTLTRTDGHVIIKGEIYIT